MSAPQPVLGYPSKTDAVIALREQGLSHAEIAARTGISRSNVMWMASHRYTRFRKLMVPGPVIRRLTAAAEARGITPQELAGRLLTTIVAEDLLEAILDDGDEAQSTQTRETIP